MKDDLIKKAAEVLFNTDEVTVFSDFTATKNKTKKARYNLIKGNLMQFSINPGTKNTTRCTDNVTAMRNFLLEIDGKTDENEMPIIDPLTGNQIGISVEDQVSFIEESKLPYSVCTFSGGKSNHYIICLTDPIEKVADYQAIHKALRKALRSYGAHCDSKCQDPSRFSRTPNAIRLSSTGNVMQVLNSVNRRITLSELEAWLEANGQNWRDYVFVPRKHVDVEPTTATTEEALEFIMKYYIKEHGFVKGNVDNFLANTWFPTCLRAGIPQNIAETYAIKNWAGTVTQSGPNNDYDHILAKAAYIYKPTSKWWNAARIQVRSKSELEEFGRQKGKENRKSAYNQFTTPDIKSIDDIIDDITGEVTPTTPRQLDITEYTSDPSRYIMVLDEYYMKSYSRSGQLKKLNKATVKRNGLSDAEIAILPWFEGFTNEPLHDEFREIVNGLWNTYHPLTIVANEGEFPLCMKLIKHLFGKNKWDQDQVEEILDWLTVLIRYPKHKLHHIYLYSIKQGTSKSGFGKLIQLLLGLNYISLKARNFEEKFNTNWISKLVVHIDEANFSDPKQVNNDLKYYGTESVVQARRMNTDPYDQPFFAKFLITTNQIDGIFITNEDRRIWAREAPPLEDSEDPKYMEKIKNNEINAFYHFLLTREMKYKKPAAGSSFWLPLSVVNTASKRKISDINSSDEFQLLTIWLTNWFEMDPLKLEEIKFTVGDITPLIEWGKRVTGNLISKVLREELMLDYSSVTIRNYNNIRNTEHTGKFFTAKRSQFITSALEQTDFFIDKRMEKQY